MVLSIFIYHLIDPNSINFGEFGYAFLLFGVHLISLISIGLLFSTIFNRKSSLAFSFGMLIFFYIIGNFWTQFPEVAQGIKYISIFYYYDTNSVLIDHSLNGYWINILFLVIYSIVLILVSLELFRRRNIPVYFFFFFIRFYL